MLAKTLTQEYFDQQFEKLTLAIAKGFEATATKEELGKLNEKVDGMQVKLDNVLYKELPRLETRVIKIENHLKLKTAH